MNRKIYRDIMSGKCDNNIRFEDFCSIIGDLGFVLKGQKGSHIVYYHSQIKERMTVQSDGSKAKGYQVRQLRNIINKYGL